AGLAVQVHDPRRAGERVDRLRPFPPGVSARELRGCQRPLRGRLRRATRGNSAEAPEGDLRREREVSSLEDRGRARRGTLALPDVAALPANSSFSPTHVFAITTSVAARFFPIFLSIRRAPCL